jgi:K+-transporting ATPase A subunit
MFIIPNPIWIAIDAANIAILLLLWRIVAMGPYGHQLEKIRQKAETILDSLTAAIDRLWFKISGKHLSAKGRLLAMVLLLSAGRFVLCGIMRLL